MPMAVSTATRVVNEPQDRVSTSPRFTAASPTFRLCRASLLLSTDITMNSPSWPSSCMQTNSRMLCESQPGACVHLYL